MSRDQLARLLEELDQRDLSELSPTELSQLANTFGRLCGLASEDATPSGNMTITVRRTAMPLPTERPAERLLPPATPAKTW